MGKNMLFDDETVRQLYAEEKGVSKGVSVSSLCPGVSKGRLDSTLAEVVTDIANKDVGVRRLAQRLSDEIEGVGMVSALELLAKCGMLMNEMEGEK